MYRSHWYVIMRIPIGFKADTRFRTLIKSRQEEHEGHQKEVIQKNPAVPARLSLPSPHVVHVPHV
jgi:hypothetical protein